MNKQKNSLTRRITLVDCTLREGEQAPGLYFSREEKLEILTLLEQVGIVLVDAGMPAISNEEFNIMSELVRRARSIRIAASVRARRDEIELAEKAGVQEIFLIFPSSPIHIRNKLNLPDSETLDEAASLVEFASAKGITVNLVAEDSSRAKMKFLISLCRKTRDSGARRIFFCDTVGIMTPSAMTRDIKTVIENVGPGIEYGIHCHNDLGLATANTLAAIEAGVDYPTVTLNGIGERCGNAPMHEIALIVDKFLGFNHTLNLTSIRKAAETVERISGILIPQFSPLIGFNAFQHKSGIHIDGILKDPRMYEPFAPEQVGGRRTYVLGKHTGQAYIRHLFEKHGINTESDQIDKILTQLKKEHSKSNSVREAFSRLKEFYDSYNILRQGPSEQEFITFAKERITLVRKNGEGQEEQ